jgi:hypothetical protein
VPAAVIAAMLLVLLPAPAPVASLASGEAAPPSAVAAPPAPTVAAWQPDHSALDGSRVEAAPDASPMSVAAYGH